MGPSTIEWSLFWYLTDALKRILFSPLLENDKVKDIQSNDDTNLVPMISYSGMNMQLA